MARMVGRLNTSVCGCCDQRSGTGKGKDGQRRRNKRRDREQWKREIETC